MNDRRQAKRIVNRRVFLRSGIIFSGAALAGARLLGAGEKEKEEGEIPVGPPEDLMREHGVLKRVLLIYGEALGRLYAKRDLPPDALADAARIIRSFVEDYHEKLEEDLEVRSARHAAPLIIFEIIRSFFVGFKCFNRSLTFWICDACSFKVAVKALSSLAC